MNIDVTVTFSVAAGAASGRKIDQHATARTGVADRIDAAAAAVEAIGVAVGDEDIVERTADHILDMHIAVALRKAAAAGVELEIDRDAAGRGGIRHRIDAAAAAIETVGVDAGDKGIVVGAADGILDVHIGIALGITAGTGAGIQIDRDRRVGGCIRDRIGTAAAAIETVDGSIGDKGIVMRAADQILDVGQGIALGIAAAGGSGRQIDGHAGSRAGVAGGIVAGSAAGQYIGAGAAFKITAAAGAADNGVVAAAAIQGVVGIAAVDGDAAVAGMHDVRNALPRQDQYIIAGGGIDIHQIIRIGGILDRDIAGFGQRRRAIHRGNAGGERQLEYIRHIAGRGDLGVVDQLQIEGLLICGGQGRQILTAAERRGIQDRHVRRHPGNDQRFDIAVAADGDIEDFGEGIVIVAGGIDGGDIIAGIDHLRRKLGIVGAIGGRSRRAAAAVQDAADLCLGRQIDQFDGHRRRLRPHHRHHRDCTGTFRQGLRNMLDQRFVGRLGLIISLGFRQLGIREPVFGHRYRIVLDDLRQLAHRRRRNLRRGMIVAGEMIVFLRRCRVVGARCFRTQYLRVVFLQRNLADLIQQLAGALHAVGKAYLGLIIHGTDGAACQHHTRAVRHLQHHVDVDYLYLLYHAACDRQVIAAGLIRHHYLERTAAALSRCCAWC